MARKKKTTTIDGGPSLFPPEAEAVLKNADRFDAVYNDLLRRRDLYDQTGIYSPFIPDTLKDTAKVFYCNKSEQLRDTLTASGLTADTIEAVTTDYITVLCGPLDFTATPEQMNEALTAIEPIQAYLIDKYALYFSLFLNYSKYVRIAEEYAEQVANPEATAETKRGFMAVPRPLDAKGVCWLIEHGISAVTDWFGIQPAEVSAFISAQRDWAALNEYTYFYFIAKYQFNATPQELAAIKTPPVKTQKPFTEVGELYADVYAKQVKQAADAIATAATTTAPTRAEQERAQQVAKDWNDEKNAEARTIQLHETPNLICSRPVEISPNGAEIVNTLPVQRYIDKFTTDNPDKYGTITPMTVQKVFEAVNQISNFSPSIINGQYRFKTSRSDFAKLCGYQDANQDQKTALLGALLMLSNLYVVVDRPLKITEYTTTTGRKRKLKSGGRTAVKVLNVPEFELQNEGLIIDISPEAFTGKPTLITYDMFQQLRAEAKGLSQSRFNAQLLAKGHKAEDDLTAEVFGYDEKLKLAEGKPEEYKHVKTMIQNHRADDRKRVARWFEEYAAKGILKYKYNAKTKVYSWERLDTRTPEEQAPEEQ